MYLCSVLRYAMQSVSSIVSLVTDDAILFFIVFECLLLIMYWYLLQYITSARALYAVLLLTVYTIVGSSVLLSALCYYYIHTGSSMATCMIQCKYNVIHKYTMMVCSAYPLGVTGSK